jgi:polyisoprenoid-binding protein YceI
MKKLSPIVIVLAVVLLLGALAILYVLRPPAEASAPIEAIPLTIEATDTAVVLETVAETTETAASTPLSTEIAQPTTAASTGLTIYQISSTDSQVRFELDEDLRGNRITVVGATDQIAGELAFNLNDLSQTQVGVIQINARTLATDNNNRNRAIQNEILDTGAYEFITFTPTAVNGLPASINIGESVNFTIDGELTIRDVTTPVTFNVQATAVSETQISGTASTIISRSNYNLNIPSVPNVANVEEEVELYIDFVANAS